MNPWNEDFKKIEGIHCNAKYNKQLIPENQGNPLIESIPDRLGVEDFFDNLYSVPKYRTGSSNLNIEDRLALVRQVRPSFWLPTPSQYEKYRGIYNMIKIGYQSRNPIDVMYNRQFSIGWDKIYSHGLDESGANIAGNIQTAQSLSEIGLSGMGKSKNYERILKKLFPQVIHHSEYQQKRLTLTQVVWLKIECPSGKSVGSLCRNFYDEVDKILGTNFYEKFGEKAGNIDNLAKRMVKVAAQINLGVLIIDEIQNIHKAHSGGDERIINFITELVNTIGVPVIMIGTFKAMYIFRNSLATSRRGLPDEYSENIVSFMEESSWEWKEFISALWKLQYTNEITPLNPELASLMYYHTMGIPDIAVKFFMHIQAKAILNGEIEKLTPELINQVASKTLQILQPVFERIRNGESIHFDEIEDVELEWGNFSESSFKEKDEVQDKIIKQHIKSKERSDSNIIIQELVGFSTRLVSSREVAEELAHQVYNKSKDKSKKEEMFSELAKLCLDKINDANSKEISDKEKTKDVKSSRLNYSDKDNDMRLIVSNGLKKGLTTEEALEEANIVRASDELYQYFISKEVKNE